MLQKNADQDSLEGVFYILKILKKKLQLLPHSSAG